MTETPQIVTRFAPSPTGMLHIGGARTALFNWLFARNQKGHFKLRIEDTDRERSTSEAIDAILEGLRWLELDWDGDIVFQSERAARHVEVAESLLASGHAYRCYAAPEELQQMRETAKAEGRHQGYDGRWRDRDPAEAPSGVDPVIRLKTPLKGETLVADVVQGEVVLSNQTLDDFVLLRSDGTPTYMLSVVVDDHDMNVTHIIRGDDHLVNAARQTHLYEALGWQVPIHAHLPLIHGPDGAKLSKRHGSPAISAYRDKGYLPDGMKNYLLRLGWSHGDDELIPTEKAIEWFALEGINKAPARLDFDKLDFVNGHYLQLCGNEDLIDVLLPHLAELTGQKISDDVRQRLRRVMDELKPRSKTLVELAENSLFLANSRPLQLTSKAKKLLDDEAKAALRALLDDLRGVEDWGANELEKVIRQFCDSRDMKLGKIAQPLRAALTGGANSPGIFDVLVALGQEEAVGRITDQV